jgi:hypothetical protein
MTLSQSQESTMQKESDAPTLFSVNSKERQVARMRKLQLEEKQENESRGWI